MTPAPLVVVAVLLAARALRPGAIALARSGRAAAAPGRMAWAASWRAARARRRRDDMVLAQLPDVIDLFRVAVGAGLTVPLAVPAVAERTGPGPIQAGLADLVRRTGLGAGLAEGLDTLTTFLGEPVRGLGAALSDALRYGAPVADSLDRLAEEARLDRQRRVERAARRAPVHLLFPLVLCILPAFVLLTLAPVFASGLRALRL